MIVRNGSTIDGIATVNANSAVCLTARATDSVMGFPLTTQNGVDCYTTVEEKQRSMTPEGTNAKTLRKVSTMKRRI